MLALKLSGDVAATWFCSSWFQSLAVVTKKEFLGGLKHIEFFCWWIVTGFAVSRSGYLVGLVFLLFRMGSRCCSGGMAGIIPVAIL